MAKRQNIKELQLSGFFEAHRCLWKFHLGYAILAMRCIVLSALARLSEYSA